MASASSPACAAPWLRAMAAGESAQAAVLLGGGQAETS